MKRKGNGGIIHLNTLSLYDPGRGSGTGAVFTPGKGLVSGNTAGDGEGADLFRQH
ncbi:MAG: hypothetical protein LBB48_01020 [Treponema sp.]|nr:hypothetical protein [Treponema sp.]